MSNTPAPDPVDAKLAALLDKHDRQAQQGAPQACATCRALWITAERARVLRDPAQAQKAAAALEEHRRREHGPQDGGDAA